MIIYVMIMHAGYSMIMREISMQMAILPGVEKISRICEGSWR
jgi:hypothetical protein